MGLKLWKIFLVVLCTIVLGTLGVNSMFSEICTSTGTDSISLLDKKNISNEGIKVEIIDFNSTGIVFKVDAQNDQITRIVLWVELTSTQQEQHIGSFTPIPHHAYIKGCYGDPNSTITDFNGFKNTSQIIYQWSAPPGTTVEEDQSQLSSNPTQKRHNNHNNKGYSLKLHKQRKHCISNRHEKSHHHKKYNHKKYKKTRNGNCKKYKKPNSKSHRKFPVSHIENNNTSSPSSFTNDFNTFQIKGSAIVASNPNMYIIFASNMMQIDGKIPPFNNSLNTSSSDKNDNNYVSSFT
ncbi:6737_t:CDS:2, partial [Scutellospora calospora]